MGLAASLDADLDMIAADDPRAVTFYRRAGSSSYDAGQPVAGVVREPLPSGMLNAAGAYLPQGSMRFFFRASRVTGGKPEGGDRVVDADGRGYQVDSATPHGEGTWYDVTGAAEA